MSDHQTNPSDKTHGDKLESSVPGTHNTAQTKKAEDALEIPAPEEHLAEGSTKLHGDKLEHPEK